MTPMQFAKEIPQLRNGKIVMVPMPEDWKGVAVSAQEEANEHLYELMQVPAKTRIAIFRPWEIIDAAAETEWCEWHCAECNSLNVNPDNTGDDGKWWNCLDCNASGEGEASWKSLIHGVICYGTDDPIHPDWVRSIRDECRDAELSFYFAGWGAWSPFYDRDIDDPDWRKIPRENQNVRRMNLAGGSGFHGKRLVYFRHTKKGEVNRLLDGRTHDDMPQGAP